MTKYVIIEATDVSSVDFTKVLETSLNTLRYSTDESKTFVKYVGSKPGFLYGKPTNTHAEMLVILNDPDGEWFTESPF